MNVIFTLKSGDKKTGCIPASYYPRYTCPIACPLRKSLCYGEYGNTRIHWDKLNRGECGIPFNVFLDRVDALPKDTLWRSAIVGDFPRGKHANEIGKRAYRIVDASKGKRGYAYTHYPLNTNNKQFFNYARSNGFAINLSTNNIKHALELKQKTDIPIVTIVPSTWKESQYTNGIRFLVCPNTLGLVSKRTNKPVQCVDCRLCAKVERDSVICFPAHGVRKNQLDQMVAV